MKEIIVKAYGWLEPANEEILQTLEPILRSWYIEDAMCLEDGALRLAYEGEYFPHEEIARALFPFLNEKSKGKMDIMDLEAWTLQRYFFDTSQVIVSNTGFSALAKKSAFNENTSATVPSRITTLNHVLESCQKK